MEKIINNIPINDSTYQYFMLILVKSIDEKGQGSTLWVRNLKSIFSCIQIPK